MENAKPATPYQALLELENAYADYRAVLIRARTAGVGESIGFFLRGQGNPRVGQALADFDPVITALVEALAAMLASCPAEQADELASRALEIILFYPLAGESTVDLSQTAFEGRGLALIPFLTPERRRALSARYKQRTPPRRMLPNQEKMWKALAGQ